jgi:iron complex transport system ATP-binding protein
LLRVDDVSFAYGDAPVLHGVTLEIAEGALAGILGPNGSGKTTLLRLLSGALRPTRGRVLLDGRDLRGIRPTRLARRLAVVPQETHLAFDYAVLEIVLMGRYPHLGAFELEGPEDVAIARDALAATGTLGLEGRSVDTLSGGEKQRVIIASALAQFGRADGNGSDRSARNILLLDEPTASLDLGYQLEIADLLLRLNAERGLTIAVSTHDLNFAAAVCRELVLLRGGEVMAAGATEAVLTPDAIARLYGVQADVRHDERAGHLTVLPVKRLAPPGGP